MGHSPGLLLFQGLRDVCALLLFPSVLVSFMTLARSRQATGAAESRHIFLHTSHLIDIDVTTTKHLSTTTDREDAQSDALVPTTFDSPLPYYNEGDGILSFQGLSVDYLLRCHLAEHIL
jgi:hypothetical protein